MLGKIKTFIILLTVPLLICGCSRYGEKRIVKLITIDGDSVKLYYYDYSGDTPSFLTAEKPNTGTQDTVVKLLSEAEYNLKLCQYAVCSSDMVKNSTAEIYKALINTKFSPDIAIIEGDTGENVKKYTEKKAGLYPLYCYKEDYKGVTGVVENPEANEKNIIISSEYYKTLGASHSFVFDILAGNLKEGIYSFERNGETISVTLGNISVFHSVENNVLHINVSSRLKSYKGLPADETSKAKVALYAQADMEKKARELLTDTELAENFNLMWYSKLAGFDKTIINVNII